MDLYSNISLRPYEKYKDTVEGSIFDQTCKIFRTAQDIYVCEPPKVYSKKLLSLIQQEFPYISVYGKEKSKLLKGRGMKNDYIEESKKTSEPSEHDILLEAEIRGFFIHWIHILLTDPKTFFKSFGVEYLDFSKSSFSPENPQSMKKKFKDYVKLGKLGGNKRYRNYANLNSVVRFLFSVAVFETIYSCISSLKKLEFLDINTTIDYVPSPSLEYFIRNSESLKQVLIRTLMFQPFDGITPYCDEEKLTENFEPWVKESAETDQSVSFNSYEDCDPESFEIMTSCYKMSGHEKPVDKVVGVDSMDPDIFPRPPAYGKREIFWAGFVGKCSVDVKKGVPPFEIDEVFSSVIVAYSLDKAAGEFNKTINISDQVQTSHLNERSENENFMVKNNEEVINGWF